MGQQLVIFISTIILLATGVLLGYVLSQLVLGFLTLNLVTFLGSLCLIIVFGTLYYVLFWEFRRQQSPSSQTQSVSSPTPTVPLQQQRLPDHDLRNKLITLLAGDSVSAQKIIDQTKQAYPNKPESWYWEKAIDDIEKGR